MSRRNQKHRRDRRYLAAVERQQAAIEAWVTGTRTAMPAPIELFLRKGDYADDSGALYLASAGGWSA